MQRGRTTRVGSAGSHSTRLLGTAIGAVVVPALFFVLLETGLRAGGYGVNTDLVRELDEATCYLNADVATRYFSPALRSIQPSIGFRLFDRHKAPGSLRVFVLGESTAAGFPFHVNGSFAGFLEDELRATYPDRDIDVINCGMSAISSYVVLDFARQLVRYEPDLFLVYTGHNEFYGALGAASARAAKPSRDLTLLEMKLASRRTYQLVCNTIFRMRPGTKDGANGRSLMAAMIGGTAIGLDDAVHKQAEQSFEANLLEIIRIAKQNSIPVIISTQTSNLRDMPPFQSAGNADNDTTNAGSAYARASALQADATQMNAARREYIRARDHDVIHFRACSRFNDIIRNIAATHDVPLIDMDAIFAAHTPGHVPGRNLFHEHLHPNLDGTRLMASAFLEAIQHMGVVPSAPPLARSYEEALADACITPLDLELAHQRIVSMTSQPPFHDSFGTAGEFPDASPDVTATARRVLERNVDLAAAHEELGRHYLTARNLPRALEEYRALAKIYPLSPAGPLRHALEECRSLLAADPQHPAVRRLLERLSPELGSVARGNQK